LRRCFKILAKIVSELIEIARISLWASGGPSRREIAKDYQERGHEGLEGTRKEAKDGPRGSEGIPIGAKVGNEDAKRSLMASQRNPKHPPVDRKSATKTSKGPQGIPERNPKHPPWHPNGEFRGYLSNIWKHMECRCPYRALGLPPLLPPLASF